MAVSEKTRSVLINHGMDGANISVSYIGSRHLDNRPITPKIDFESILHISYLGYARRDKGFFFLLRALKALPEELAERIALTVAVKIQDRDPVVAAVGRLARTLQSVSLHNGYTASQLPSLLKGVSLGIVPSLWEDNLPQVAIEYVAQGIPVLVSNRGGASEISGNQHFIFEADSIPSFTEALRKIVCKEVDLGAFWTRPPNVRPLSVHVDELLALYKSDLSQRSASASTQHG